MSFVIAVDFDGTIVDHRFPFIHNENPGAIYWLRKWKSKGATLILWTMRSGVTLSKAVDWCLKRDVKFDGVNHNDSQSTWTESPKCYANVYVDDAAFGCPLWKDNPDGRGMVDWSIVGPTIYNMLKERIKRINSLKAEKKKKTKKIKKKKIPKKIKKKIPKKIPKKIKKKIKKKIPKF